jgi:hypothetical protein
VRPYLVSIAADVVGAGGLQLLEDDKGELSVWLAAAVVCADVWE